jgi:hypothetical protein
VQNDFLTLAPNPADQKIMITWGGQLNDKTYLEMYDNLGRKVHTEKLTTSQAELSVADFTPGIYTIIIQNDAGQAKPEKIIITH